MTTTETCQIVDEDKNFNNDISDYLDSVNVLDSGLNYHVVSVFGSQSTGKSTLLNALFGTDFNVMNEATRQQTTKGIWLAKSSLSVLDSPTSSSSSSSSDSFLDIGEQQQKEVTTPKQGGTHSNILVMDVEGTDGRERGEDQDFERKSALFALATSEVLIVNMWENQVGLYQGANMGLLKTVFEVNLSLFHASKQTPRSLILFVIRDHIGTTPLENLSQTILADLNRQWESIAKPSEDLKSSTIHDFFDIQFDALPHKVLLPDQFSSQVQQLSVRFTNPSSPSYVFNPKYHRNVPMDGWNMYSGKIWEQIEMNKDLDLPTQQILVARFRCGEIASQAMEQFEIDFNKHSLGDSSKSVIDGFASIVTSLREGALKVYDSSASKYNSKVYLGQRQDLSTQIDSKLLTLFKAQLSALHKSGLSQFTSDLETVGKQTSSSSSSFASVVENAKTKALEYFLVNVKEVSEINPDVFSYADEFEAYQAELDNAEQNRKAQEITRITNRSIKKLKHLLDEELDPIFSSGSDDMWDKVLKFFNSTVAVILEPYKKNESDDDVDFLVGASPETNMKGYTNLLKKSWLAFDTKLKELASTNNVLSILQDTFELSFKYDENKVPIVWNAGDDIETPYIQARDKALDLLPKFSVAKLSDGEKIAPPVSLSDEEEDADEADNIGDFATRINKTRQEEIRSKFKRQADSTFVEAKRSTTQTAAQIPFFMIILLVVLGWNEFMAVLRNPFLFMFCLMIGAGAYITFSLNMWGPMISVADAMGNRAIDIAKQKLRDALEVPAEHRERSRVAIPGGEDIELSDMKNSTNSKDENSRT